MAYLFLVDFFFFVDFTGNFLGNTFRAGNVVTVTGLEAPIWQN